MSKDQPVVPGKKKKYKFTRDDLILAIVVIWGITMVTMSYFEYRWLDEDPDVVTKRLLDQVTKDK